VAFDASMEKRSRTVVLRNDPYVNIFPGVERRGTVVIKGRQITVSEGHPFRKKSHFRGKDIGGEFYSLKETYNDNRGDPVNPVPQFSYSVTGSDPSRRYYYNGGLYPMNPSPLLPGNDGRSFGRWFPPDLSYSDSQLAAFGTTAIARCEPTKSPADLAVAVAELVREGLPKMIGHTAWQQRLRDLNLGSEFLNLQFGWLPLAADIKDAASVFLNVNDMMEQYERDSGKVVRRGYTFPTIREITKIQSEDPNAAGLWTGDADRPASGWSEVYPPGAVTFREREITRKLWFSGAFSYYLPDDFYSRAVWKQKAYLVKELFGLELTPEVIWNLTPWSWAADWVTNIGDNMHNLSAFGNDGLVMRYGYLMEHTIIKDTWTTTGFKINGLGSTPLQASFTTEVKKRKRASPFGFGLDEGSFTPRQLAIIAALGISRAK